MDLFVDQHKQPEHLAEICDDFMLLLDRSEVDPHEVCKQFKAEVEQIGYTFEFGDDAKPMNLRAMTRH